jgi:predicted nuclease of predicted toxin-antitoxin system
MAVAQTFKAHGHKVVPFEGTVKRGSQDTLVCRVAEANDAILVAFDKDMKAAARRFGIGGERFKRLSLIHFQCPEPMASTAVALRLNLSAHR